MEIERLFSDWKKAKNEKGWPKCSKKKDTFETNETYVEHEKSYDIFESDTSTTKSVLFKTNDENECSTDNDGMIFDKNTFQTLVKDVALENRRGLKITKVALSLIQQSCEDYLVDIFRDCGNSSLMRNNQAIDLKDFYMALKMRFSFSKNFQ
ncbi:DgyrCDS7508 [Dimorphilus gyrociliatus]|uniref:DgyrCDS7508 n=1 Tax=Dimorphilus gyrociliatus TaxID=2664684 RepID=A0A7I8VR87_9ANNE|nr:DgyrCDS7508 [Dimorphilus gyrociliatus]